MKKLATMALMAACTVAVLARPAFLGVFDKTYPQIPKTSALAKAKCGACHVGMTKKLNAYGLDLKKAMGGAKALTAAALKKVENLDSNKNGVKNIDEIKKGTLPG